MEQPLNIILDLLLSTYLAIIYFSEVIFSWLEGFGRVEISQLLNNWGNLSFTDSIILSLAIILAFISSFAGWVSFICILSLFGIFCVVSATGDHRTNATNDTEEGLVGGMGPQVIVLLISISLSCISYFSLLTFNETTLDTYELLIAFVISVSCCSFLIYKFYDLVIKFIYYTIAKYLPVFFFVFLSIVLSKLNYELHFVMLLVGVLWALFDGITINIANFNKDLEDGAPTETGINGFINELFDGKNALQNTIKWVYIGYGSGFYLIGEVTAYILAVFLGVVAFIVALGGWGRNVRVPFLGLYFVIFIIAYWENIVAFF
jgi:hypothetical protein